MRRIILTCLFLPLSAAPCAAAAPISSYFGVWTGDIDTNAGKYLVSVNMAAAGPYITGSYKATPKGQGLYASGTYRGVKRPDGCYNVTVLPTSKTAGRLALAACVRPDNAFEVRSPLMNGACVPSGDFTSCAAKGGGPLVSFSGVLHRKGGKPAEKKPGKKAAGPRPEPQRPLQPITLEMKKN